MCCSHELAVCNILEGKKLAFWQCILHWIGVDLADLAHACMYSDIPRSYQLVGGSLGATAVQVSISCILHITTVAIILCSHALF